MEWKWLIKHQETISIYFRSNLQWALSLPSTEMSPAERPPSGSSIAQFPDSIIATRSEMKELGECKWRTSIQRQYLDFISGLWNQRAAHGHRQCQGMQHLYLEWSAAHFVDPARFFFPTWAGTHNPHRHMDTHGSYVNESNAALQHISINLYVICVMKEWLSALEVYSSLCRKYN